MKTPRSTLLAISILLAAPFSVMAENFGHFGRGEGMRPGWQGGDIRHFGRGDINHWRGGRWRHGWHDGRIGWWWVVAGTGLWYFYPGPHYPYPDPYVPPIVEEEEQPPVMIEQAPPAPPSSNTIPGTQQPQYWYYCDAGKGYYPYVASCPSGWKKVPATPPDAPQ